MNNSKLSPKTPAEISAWAEATVRAAEEANRQANAELIRAIRTGADVSAAIDRYLADAPMTALRLVGLICDLETLNVTRELKLSMELSKAREEREAREKARKKAALKGAETNKIAAKDRKAEACRIYAAHNPKTGAPWESKETCIKYLMASHDGAHGWSRAAIIGYLPKKVTNSSARKAPKRGR